MHLFSPFKAALHPHDEQLELVSIGGSSLV